MAQIYIAGIHTDTGKTHFSAAFCKVFGYGYFKLVQAGQEEDRAFIKQFVPECTIFDNGISLRTPASPHIAKIIERCDYQGSHITIPSAQNLIIELAGGLFTPLDDTQCMIDYMRLNPKPCVLVGRYYLGCINHILLSISALKAHNVPLLCLAMMTSSDDSYQTYINDFLHNHPLLQGTPLVRTPFFTQENFSYACDTLASQAPLITNHLRL